MPDEGLIQEDQIRREEEVRHRIRKELERQEWGAWAFLNSGFGLWLLSTVVVGLIAFAYHKLEASASQRAQDSKTQKELEAELGLRLARLRDRVDSMSRRLQEDRKDKAASPDGWAVGLRNRYRATEKPSISYSPALKDAAVVKLLDDLAELHERAGRDSPIDRQAFERGRKAWQEVKALCEDRYEEIKAKEAKARAGEKEWNEFYDMMEAYTGKLSKNLRGDLAAWLPKEYE